MKRGFVLVTALLTTSVAWADVAPSKDGVIHPICPERAGYECVTGGRSKSDVADDACTSAELERLGLRFYCEESHNDRLTTHWCRAARGKRAPFPDGLHDELTAGSYADAHAFATTQRFGQYRIDALRKADAEVPASLLEAEKRAIEAREPCRRLAAKYMRCGLEAEKCRPTWIQMGLVDGGAEAPSSKTSGDATDAGDAGGPVDASTGSSPPSKPRSACGCEVVGRAPSSMAPLAGLFVVLAAARRRRGRQGAAELVSTAR